MNKTIYNRLLLFKESIKTDKNYLREYRILARRMRSKGLSREIGSPGTIKSNRGEVWVIR